MKVALICNKKSRMPLGKLYKNVLDSYKNIEARIFDLSEIQDINQKYDLYLRLGEDNFEPIPKNLHPVGWWVIDTHLKKSYKKIKTHVKNYDFIFCAQKEAVIRLNRETGKETHWIPFAAEEVKSDFKFVSREDKIWDVAFIGTRGKYSLRKVVLELVRISYKNSFLGKAEYHKLRDYYSKSRIVINYSINNDINARIFEAMSAGALVITNRIRDNGFEDIFKEGKDIVVYDDIIKDMKQKIDYYLKHTDERERISKNGFEYVKQNHTYWNRVNEMFKIMGVNLVR